VGVVAAVIKEMVRRGRVAEGRGKREKGRCGRKVCAKRREDGGE